ncbi:MAG: FkbM family methyltransferase [Gemmatimonadetes bacterium]|nr:FkbM family methyltransferase [Gemmatimonadota bacterium]
MTAAVAALVPPYSRLSICLHTPSGESELQFEFDETSEVQRAMRDALASGAFYEPETTMLLLTILRPGDTFVDVGGHVGYFSVVGSAVVGEQGRVITFEPAPSNHERLLHHLALNGCSNVLPLPLAVGERPGPVTLHLNSDNDGGHALWDVRAHPLNDKSRARPRSASVWLTRIADVVGNRPVRAMKMDIEGSEFAALAGARALLEGAEGVPFVIAEINRGALNALGASEERLRAMMDELGYDTWVIRLTEPQLQKIDPGVTVTSDFVFNVLFWKRGVPLP